MKPHLLLALGGFAFGFLASHLSHSSNPESPTHPQGLTERSPKSITDADPHQSTFGHLSQTTTTNDPGSLRRHTIATIREQHPEIFDYVIHDQESGILYGLIRELSFLQPQKAATLLDDYPPGDLRDAMVEKLVENWSQKNPSAALAWLTREETQLSPTERERHTFDVLTALAKVSPNAAQDHLNRLSSPEQRDSIIVAMAEGWMKQGHDKAFAWLGSLDEQNVSNTLIQTVYTNLISHYAEQEPSAAAALVQELADPRLQSELISPVTRNLARENPADAIAWVADLKNASTQALAIHELTNHQEVSSAPLLDLVTQNPQLLKEDGEGILLQALVSKAAADNPRQLLDRLSDFPSDHHSTIVAGVATEVFTQDPAQAQDWLDSLPPGNTYDQTATQFMQGVFETNPAQALHFAQSIQAPQLRKEALTFYLTSIPETDLPQAQNQINLASFSPTDRQDLQKLINQRLHRPDLLAP